jgi:hypothetical protein
MDLISNLINRSAQTFFDLFLKAPALHLWLDSPTYSLIPQAWLEAHEIENPPLRAIIVIENFGSTVLKNLRIKLYQTPDHPVETGDLPKDSWQYTKGTGEITIKALDPKCKAFFVLFFDSEPQDKLSPQLLCDDVLVGAKSDWLWELHQLPILLVTFLTAIFLLLFFVISNVYREEWSSEARERKAIFEQYANANGLSKCEPRTLNADKGEVHEGKIRQHINGVPGALALNKSSSLEELLKRRNVYVCIDIRGK